MKAEARVVGFDDAPHARGDATCDLVGVVMRGGSYVEAVLHATCTPDGDDATAAIAATVTGYRGFGNLTAILLHNLMVGGFNVVDVVALHEATGLPVLAVAKGQPDLPAVRRALVEGRIPGGEAKWERIRQAEPSRAAVLDGAATLVAIGLPAAEAQAVLAATTVRGILPEPIRLAHLIGAGWRLGQSRGS